MGDEKDIGIECNEFSKNYTQDMVRCVPHYRELISSFVNFLPETMLVNSLLDLGCGNANITTQFIQLYPNATYDLVDASSEMIELCRKQFQDYQVHYHHSYFRDFIFPTDYYDVIAAGFSLHHCTNDEKISIFRKIFSALKRGGIFAYSDLMISKTNPEHPMLLKKWGDFVNVNYPDGEKWAWVMEHYRLYDKPEDLCLQQEWLVEVGFKEIIIPYRDGPWIHLQAVKP